MGTHIPSDRLAFRRTLCRRRIVHFGAEQLSPASDPFAAVCSGPGVSCGAAAASDVPRCKVLGILGWRTACCNARAESAAGPACAVDGHFPLVAERLAPTTLEGTP